LYNGVTALVNNLEWPRLDILLDDRVFVSSADQSPALLFRIPDSPAVVAMDSLDVEDSVGGVHGSLVLCGLTDQSLLLGEGNKGWSGKTTLLVGDCGTVSNCARLSDMVAH